MSRLAMIGLSVTLGCSEAPVDAIESYADDICACTDADCIESVRAEWEQDHARRVGGAALSETERVHYLEAMGRALDCQGAVPR